MYQNIVNSDASLIGRNLAKFDFRRTIILFISICKDVTLDVL